MKQNVVWGVVAVALLVVGVNFPLNGQTVTERVIEKVGGQTQSARAFFQSGITVGGNVLATTTGVTLTAYTLSAQEMDNMTMNINPSVNLTVSVSATSSGFLIPNVGDEYKFTIKNASSTVASTLTLDNVDASVGIANTTGGNLVLAGGNWAVVTLKRLSNTGVIMEVFVNEYIPG